MDSTVSGKCIKANLYMEVTSCSCNLVSPVCTGTKKSCNKQI